MPYIDGKDVKRRASGNWDDILRRLAPSLAPFLDKPGRHGPCPVHGTEGYGDGFRVYKDVKETGGGHCNTCGGFPDGFSLIAFATGDSYKDILADVHKILGGADVQSDKRAPAAPAKPKVDPAVEDASIRQRLSSVYASALTLTHPDAAPARLYLKQRGFTLLPEMLRMHPGLHWQDFEGKNRSGPHPTLIGLVVDSKERGVCLHRTYLSREGTKASVPQAKKLMSHPSYVSLQGSAIRLFPQAETIGVCEGIETAIAVTEATCIPCWPLVSATFMPSFLPPPGVKRVIVFADKNSPTKLHPTGHGQEAAHQLRENLWAKGIKCSVAIPPSPIPDGAKDIDWCDEFVRSGRTPFASLLAQAA